MTDAPILVENKKGLQVEGDDDTSFLLLNLERSTKV